MSRLEQFLGGWLAETNDRLAMLDEEIMEKRAQIELLREQKHGLECELEREIKLLAKEQD